MYFWLLLILAPFGSGEKLIEISHELNSESKFYPESGIPFNKSSLLDVVIGPEVRVTSFAFVSAEHTGTHMDAPTHFNPNGWTVNEIPLGRLFGPAAVIDIRSKVEENSIYRLSAQDVADWVKKFGIFSNNSIVLVNTGWSSRYNNTVSYFGHPSDPTKFIFPGISAEAMQTFVDYKKLFGVEIVGVGIDGPSIDFGPSQIFEAHQIGSQSNIYFLENLRDLEKLPPIGAQLVVLPMKITGGSGGTCRVVARIDETCKGKGLFRCRSVVVDPTSLLNKVSGYFHNIFAGVQGWFI